MLPQPTEKDLEIVVKTKNNRLTGYMWFCKLRRSIVQQQRPSLSFSAIGKLMGELWNNLSPDKQDEWNRLCFY
jgi:hypothetical protein